MGGTITLSGTSENSQINSGNAGDLTNVDNLIQGKGFISGIQFTNQGEVKANDATGTLTLTPIANMSFANQNLMMASNGGHLLLSRTIENAGGVIEAQANSTVSLSFATINGGIVRTSGNGTIEIVSGTSTFENLDNDAPVNIQNSRRLNVVGLIENTGEFNVNATTNLTDFGALSPATISGSGSINLVGSNSRIIGQDLELVDQTVTGTGQLNADITFNGATIKPGNSIGQLTFLQFSSNR